MTRHDCVAVHEMMESHKSHSYDRNLPRFLHTPTATATLGEANLRDLKEESAPIPRGSISLRQVYEPELRNLPQGLLREVHLQVLVRNVRPYNQ